jgi:hypothetical protein
MKQCVSLSFQTYSRIFLWFYQEFVVEQYDPLSLPLKREEIEKSNTKDKTSDTQIPIVELKPNRQFELKQRTDITSTEPSRLQTDSVLPIESTQVSECLIF